MTDTLILDLYEAFEQAKPDFVAAGFEPVGFIDRFRGQPLNPEQFEYYSLPAIFISRNAAWERDGKVYNANIGFDFHLVTEPTWEMSNIATNKEEGLKYYRFVNMVRKVFDKFSSEEISSLERTNDREIDTGVIIYEVLGYTGKYYEQQEEETVAAAEDLEEYDGSLVKMLGR